MTWYGKGNKNALQISNFYIFLHAKSLVMAVEPVELP